MGVNCRTDLNTTCAIVIFVLQYFIVRTLSQADILSPVVHSAKKKSQFQDQCQYNTDIFLRLTNLLIVASVL